MDHSMTARAYQRHIKQFGLPFTTSRQRKYMVSLKERFAKGWVDCLWFPSANFALY